MQETQVWSLGKEDPLEEEMETHASILAWRTPGTEEPGGLQSTGWQRVKHDCMTGHTCSTYDNKLCTFIITSAPYECFVLFSKDNKVLHLLDTRNR